MTRTRRRAAVSAVVMSLALSGSVVLVVAPLAGSSVAGATVKVAAADPSEIPGCDVDPAGPCEEPTPIVTVTVTQDPGGGSEETPVPQQTVTTTVTVPPKTKTPKSTPPPTTTQEPVAPPADPISPPVLPTASDSPQPTEDPEVQFPPNTPSTDTTSAITPAPTDTAPLDESSSTSSLYEIRNAGSEFDGATLSRQLGIPALILVLLVLFAVLIFEGRLRRLAHAAAVRKAGPRGMGHRGDPMDPMAYPAAYGVAPGFVPGPYQAGTAYAPIISLVPMQMYTPVYPEGYAPEQYPQGYEQTTAYMPAPGYEQQPVVGHGDPSGPGAGHGRAPYGQEGTTVAFQGAPASGAGTPEGRLPQRTAEFPGAPFPQEPARSGPGESLQGAPRDDFRTLGKEPVRGPGQGPSDQPFRDGPQDGSRSLGPEPQGDGSRSREGSFGPERQGGVGQESPEGRTREDFRPFGPGGGPGEGRPAQGAAEFPGAPFPQEPARSGSGTHGAVPVPGAAPGGLGAGPVVGGPGGPHGGPPGGGPHRGRGPGGRNPGPGDGPRGGPGGPHSGPGPHGGPGGGPGSQSGPEGSQAEGGQSPAEPNPTVAYPLPGQDTGKKKRGLFRRST